MSIDIGVDVDVVDEPQGAVAPTQTDTCFLIHTLADPGSGSGDSPEGLTKLTSAGQAREIFDGETELLALSDAYFAIGGATVYVSSLDEPGSGSGDALDAQEAALARFQPEHGPGQLVAPEIVTGPEMAALAEWGWAHNRIYIADGPDGASDAALAALAETVIASTGGRFATLEADTLLIPAASAGSPREVPASIVKAALIARSDRASGNPNLAAAGVNGESQYVLGIKAERTQAQRRALAADQVNTFRTVNGRVRGYGVRTLADLTNLPHWWDLSGSRTVMAARAREEAVAEAHVFGQVDAEGAFLSRYEGALRGELTDLQRVGALFGTASAPGYSVDVSSTVNPVSELAEGRVTATIRLKTSPVAEALKVNIIRRAITQEV